MRQDWEMDFNTAWLEQLHACAGHSLGGFTAISTAILCTEILECVAFESPGLTTFYHRLAEERGDSAFWQGRIINYLAVPNLINMCQIHLGRIYRQVSLFCWCVNVRLRDRHCCPMQTHACNMACL